MKKVIKGQRLKITRVWEGEVIDVQSVPNPIFEREPFDIVKLRCNGLVYTFNFPEEGDGINYSTKYEVIAKVFKPGALLRAREHNRLNARTDAIFSLGLEGYMVEGFYVEYGKELNFYREEFTDEHFERVSVA